jgi:hypothetical protein
MKTKYINENARIRNEYSSITFNMNQIKEFDSKARKHYNEQLEIKKKLQENLNGLFVLNKDYYEDERVFDYCDSKNLNDNFIKYKKEVLDEMYASNSVLYYRIIQYIYSLLIFTKLLQKSKEEYKGCFGINTFYIKVGDKLVLKENSEISKFMKIFNLRLGSQALSEVNAIVEDTIKKHLKEIYIMEISDEYIENQKDIFSIKNGGTYDFIPDIEECKVNTASKNMIDLDINYVNTCTQDEMEALGIKNKMTTAELEKHIEKIYSEIINVVSAENLKELNQQNKDLSKETGLTPIVKKEIDKYFLTIDEKNIVVNTLGENKRKLKATMPGHFKNIVNILLDVGFFKEMQNEESGIVYLEERPFKKVKTLNINKMPLEVLYCNIDDDYINELIEYKNTGVILLLGVNDIKYSEEEIDDITEHFNEEYMSKYNATIEMIKNINPKMLKTITVLGIHSLSEFYIKYTNEEYMVERQIWANVKDVFVNNTIKFKR